MFMPLGGRLAGPAERAPWVREEAAFGGEIEAWTLAQHRRSGIMSVAGGDPT
jgi:hypothetical protein